MKDSFVSFQEYDGYRFLRAAVDFVIDWQAAEGCHIVPVTYRLTIGISGASVLLRYSGVLYLMVEDTRAEKKDHVVLLVRGAFQVVNLNNLVCNVISGGVFNYLLQETVQAAVDGVRDLKQLNRGYIIIDPRALSSLDCNPEFVEETMIQARQRGYELHRPLWADLVSR